MKMLAQMFAQLFSKFERARGNQIDVLTHARLADIGINSLCTKHNCIIAPAQKLEHSVMNRRQRQWFAHGKLLECKGSGVEHRLKYTLLAPLLQDSPFQMEWRQSALPSVDRQSNSLRQPQSLQKQPT